MKLISNCLTLVIVIGFSAPASADDSLKLQLRIDPVANEAELDKLMRQNTVRIALQRHHLWEKAAESEMAKEKAQTQERNRHREKAAKGATHRKAEGGDDVSIDDSKPTDGVKEQLRERVRNQNQNGADTSKAKGEKLTTQERTRLRDALRDQRVGSDDALEKKLQQRLRERERQLQQTKTKTQEQKQHQKGKDKPHGQHGGR